MTDYERDTERRITSLESNVNNLIAELRDFKNEMRQQNQMRAEEIRELRQDMKDIQKSFYAKMDNMDSKIEGMGKQIQNLTIAAVVGFGAIAAEVGGLVFAAFR